MPPEFLDQAPSATAFRDLRAAAGLSAFSPRATEVALSNTLHGVWVYDGGVLVAMGRLIGDGGCFAQVTDVSVHPTLQRQGWGGQILARLMAWADGHLPEGCYISLIADPGAEHLYAKHGFEPRQGMARRVP